MVAHWVLYVLLAIETYQLQLLYVYSRKAHVLLL